MDSSALDAVTCTFPCGGFSIGFDDHGPRVTFLHGARELRRGLLQEVWRGLSEAPEFIARAIGLRLPARPYREVELVLMEGERVHGEAVALGPGRIRLWAGEASPPREVRSMARHEALHLLLAKNLGAGERWNDPELAFADWIVRGIEAIEEPDLPRLRAPLPRLFEPLPTSREEVQQLTGKVESAPADAARIFGPDLLAGLRRLIPAQASPAALAQGRLRLVESSLGTHYLEEAARLGGEGRLRALLLDDWLLDYEQYARALGNPPSGAGALWHLSQAGWSADPLVRLAAAAQALQAHDGCWFTEGRSALADEAFVWKNRGRIRLPLIREPARARAAPLQGLRAVLREVGAPEAAGMLEEAARGAEHFDSLALWPRLLARLLAARIPAPRAEPAALPRVQIVAGQDAEAAHRAWCDARAALCSLSPEMAAWVPVVAAPQPIDSLVEAPQLATGSLLLVHGAQLEGARLAQARRLAARLPVRGALFAGAEQEPALDVAQFLAGLPDLEPPLDPRYREGSWLGHARPEQLSRLPDFVDRATARGRLDSPLCHLLATMAPGVEACLYPAVRA